MTTPPVWAEVSCEIPAAMEETFTVFLVDLSGNGVTVENRAVDTFTLDSVPETPIKEVKAYFPADATLASHLERIREYLAAHGPDHLGFTPKEPHVVLLKEEDWANSWRQHFTPSRIGRRLVIKPTWESFEPTGDDVVIEIDPGMAFGTGTHPTTRLCLEFLESILATVEKRAIAPLPAPADLLDVGTGSGILAVAAAKLGARNVVAIDIDARAVEVTIENLALNGVADMVQVSTTPLAEVTGRYDVVVANILAEELVRLADHLIAKLRPGGYLILSGILVEREELIAAGFAGRGLEPVGTRRAEEWSCLCYRLEG